MPSPRRRRISTTCPGALTRASGPGAGGPVRQWTYHHTTEHGTTSRLQSFTEPESGTTEYGPYDLAGNLTRVVTPTGHEITFGYDANNRLTSRTTTDPAANLFITYDALGRVSEQRRGAAQSPDEVRTSFGYDAVGRVMSRQDVLDGRTFTSTLTYDAWNRVTGLTYPRPAGQTGRQVGYEYDAQWRLSRVTNDEVAFATGCTDTHGALTRYVTGLVQHDVTFDARDRVSWLRSGVVNAPVPALELSYTYDATNQVSAIDDLREGYEQTFQYDALGRLTQATGPYPTLQWAYDAMGNRTWEQRGAAQTTYTYPAATRRLTQVSGAVSESFAYDTAGRLTQDAVGTYAYRPTGELATATTPSAVAAYQYDAEGWRIKRTVGGTTTDAPSGPGAEGYVLLGNPQGTPVTARLTFIPTTGAARVRDVVLGAWARTTAHVGSEPGITGRGLVSVAVQSATPGAVAVSYTHLTLPTN